MIRKLSCYKHHHLKWCSEKRKPHSKVTYRICHISLTVLAKEAYEHLFCKQSSALIFVHLCRWLKNGLLTQSGKFWRSFVLLLIFCFSLMYSECLSFSQPCLNWKNVFTHLKRNNTVATHMSNRANRKQLISNIGFYQKSRNKSCLDIREESKNKMFIT